MLHYVVVVSHLLVLNLAAHELPKDALLFGINGSIHRSKSSFADLVNEDIPLGKLIRELVLQIIQLVKPSYSYFVLHHFSVLLQNILDFLHI